MSEMKEGAPVGTVMREWADANRYLVSVEVFDNRTRKRLVCEQFNCSHITSAERACREAAEKLDKLGMQRGHE